MSEPTEAKTNVEYRGGEPRKIDVTTQRWESDYQYRITDRFKMEGATAVLSRIEPDGKYYMVGKNEGTRAVAEQTAGELPFVQGVVMIE